MDVECDPVGFTLEAIILFWRWWWWRDVYQPLAVVYKVESLEARHQRNRRIFGCQTPWPYKPLQMPYYLARAKCLEQKKADVLLEGSATRWLPCCKLKPHVNSVAISMFRVPVILEKHLVSNNQKTQQCNCPSVRYHILSVWLLMLHAN